MFARGINPYVEPSSGDLPGCEGCAFYIPASGHCMIRPERPAPCGRAPKRQKRAIVRSPLERK